MKSYRRTYPHTDSEIESTVRTASEYMRANASVASLLKMEKGPSFLVRRVVVYLIMNSTSSPIK